MSDCKFAYEPNAITAKTYCKRKQGYEWCGGKLEECELSWNRFEHEYRKDFEQDVGADSVGVEGERDDEERH